MLLPQSDVACLLPANADPHHFSLTPKRVERLDRTDLLVRASADDGAWVGLPAGINTLDLWSDKGHAWLLPSEVRQALPLLADALTKAYPSRQKTIAEGLAAALDQAEGIERELQSALAPIRTRGVIMQHPSWQTFCRYFGIEVLDVLEAHRHGHESGPRHLQDALTKLTTRPDTMLWGDEKDSLKSLRWLAGQTPGAFVRLLDPLGDCDTEWVGLMRRNLARILESTPS